MPYDITEVRARLSEYIKEIMDVSTTPQDVERYAQFNQSLHELGEQTDYYYRTLPDGSYPKLDAEGLKKLGAIYDAALDQANELSRQQNGGLVAERMKGIARELTPMLQSDRSALNMAAGSEPMPLPELIGRAREQAVDLGDQMTASQSGNLSSRQHIQVDNGVSIEDGFFTATSRVEPKKKYDQLMDRLQEKYPPKYRQLIDAMRGAYSNAAEVNYVESRYTFFEGKTLEETRELVNENVLSEIHIYLNTTELASEVENDSQYIAFMDEFREEMTSISIEHRCYHSGLMLECEEGANIDRRNVGMSRVAGMLGKSELVANARPMMLIQNGVSVSGTFMQTADGIDLTNIKPDAPLLGFTAKNFDNPAMFDDIAAMQGLDFICGNIDRHPGNFFMRFDNPNSKDAKLCGITLIDNDLSFSNATDLPSDRRGSKFVLPSEMGVIGEDFVTAMKTMTKESLKTALSDCGLSEKEIDFAWERKMALEKKIDADRAYFKDKEPGYVEEGRLRVVPKNEWNAYSIETLAQVHKDSQFKVITNAPYIAREFERELEKTREQERKHQEIRRKMLELPPEVKQDAPKGPTPRGKVVGSGLAHESDPLNVAREGTIKLATPGLSSMNAVGNALSRRYPISWNADGKEHLGFLTPELSISGGITMRGILDETIEKQPGLADVFRDIRDYYTFGKEATPEEASEFPARADMLPWEEMGYSKEQTEALLNDKGFRAAWTETSAVLNQSLLGQIMYGPHGVEGGQRIDLRNVAMSDVGDVLNVPDLLARSTTVQLESNGTVIDGVVMETAKGLDFKDIKDGSPVALITADKAPEVYNTESGLKSMADLQILDYVCMNTDRHKDNMFYQFEGLDTDNPRFVGVQGIDNDFSFGTSVPKPHESRDKLPSLNDMQVISANMAERIKDPQTKDAIAQKMAQNGMPKSEIDAAMQRVDNVKAQIDSGKMRIVQDGEWGKGPNTIENLSDGGDTSIFHRVKTQVIDVMAQRAKNWNELSEDRRIPPKPSGGSLNFAKCVKVDNFGKGIQDNMELKQLREQAEKDFQARIEKNAQRKDLPEPQSEKDVLANILAEARMMSRTLSDADPLFHGTSKQYKQLRGSCSELQKLAQTLGGKLKKAEDTLSAEDRQKLSDALAKVSDRSSAYLMKKSSEAENGSTLSTVAEKRMKAAGSAIYRVNQLRNSHERTTLAIEAKKNPMSFVQNRLRQTQAKLSGATGLELRKRAAEAIYYKALAKAEMKFKQGKSIQLAIQMETVAKNREEIMSTPAFRRLAEMPDNVLRSLASEQKGNRLMDRFMFESVKEKKTQQVEKQQVEKQQKLAEQAKDKPVLGRI